MDQSDALGNPIDLTNKLVTAQIMITARRLPPTRATPSEHRYSSRRAAAMCGVLRPGPTLWRPTLGSHLSLDTTLPIGVPTGSTFDPTEPKQLGVTLNTGGGGESPYCGKNYGAAFGPPLTTIAYIDQIQIEPRPYSDSVKARHTGALTFAGAHRASVC